MPTVTLDTKLLVLLIVGSASRRYISVHKRLRPYTEVDFAMLYDLISASSGIILTPNTVTEASNFAGYIDDPAKTHIYENFRRIVSATEERYIESKSAAEEIHFTRLGITDSVLLRLIAGSCRLLTDDLKLYLEAERRGYMALNITHYRVAQGRL